MKILAINWQDIKNPLGGGAEVHFHEIFSRIAAMGHDITLLACKAEGLPGEEIIDGIRVIRHGNRNLFNYSVPGKFKELNRRHSYDLVIDDINKIPFYTPLFVKNKLLAISHHFFGKSIFRETGFVSGLYVYAGEKLIDFVYKNTPFAVVSQSTLDEFVAKGFKQENFRIIYNAIDQSKFKMELAQKYPKYTITYIGRLKKYKSVDHLLFSFQKVIEHFPNAELHIIGRGDYQPELERLAKKLKIENNTIFWGFIEEKKKNEILECSHCVVNTSLKEGWGISNIEANACGTPVISSNVPGLRDSVCSGKSGLLYEYGNIDELSNILIRLFEDKELLNKLSLGAIEWAKSFSWDESARQMLDYCEEIIRK
jgi:glycosyltransferase involved in cell wall biosynthesis